MLTLLHISLCKKMFCIYEINNVKRHFSRITRLYNSAINSTFTKFILFSFSLTPSYILNYCVFTTEILVGVVVQDCIILKGVSNLMTDNENYHHCWFSNCSERWKTVELCTFFMSFISFSPLLHTHSSVLTLHN